MRWDQNSIWTVAVGAEQALRAPFLGKFLADVMMSGSTISSSTLSHFFSMHVFVFPGLLIGMLVLHLYLVLFNGISEPPKLGDPVDPKTYKQKYKEMLKRSGKPFWPEAAWRDAVFSTILVLVILGCALWFGPPAIEKPPDPSIVDAAPRPDWYLVWYFAILALLPHDAENYVIILFPMALAIILLSVPFLSNKGERSLHRRPWAIGIVVFVIACIGGLTTVGFQEPWTPKFKAEALTKEIIGTSDGPVYRGAQVFNDKGCLMCHTISGHGGKRGPDLTGVANRLTKDQMIIRVVNGGYNMPGYAGNITPEQLADLIEFLKTRLKK